MLDNNTYKLVFESSDLFHSWHDKGCVAEGITNTFWRGATEHMDDVVLRTPMCFLLQKVADVFGIFRCFWFRASVCTFSNLCYLVQDQEMDAFRGFFSYTSFLSQRGGEDIPSIGPSMWYLVLLVLQNMALSGRMAFFVQHYCDVLILFFCPKASLTEMNWERTTGRASWNTFRFFAIPCSICKGLLTSWRLGSKELGKWRHWFVFQRNLPIISLFLPPLTEKCTHLNGFFVLNHSQHCPGWWFCRAQWQQRILCPNRSRQMILLCLPIVFRLLARSACHACVIC